MISSRALQRVQDLIGISCRVPFALYDAERMSSALRETETPSTLIEACRASRETHWSMNQSLHRLLEQHRSLWTSQLQRLADVHANRLSQADTRQERKALLFDGIRGFTCFASALYRNGSVKEQGDDPVLLMVGGPIGRAPSVTWETIWDVFDQQDSASMLEYQLASELLSIGEWKPELQEPWLYELDSIRIALECFIDAAWQPDDAKCDESSTIAKAAYEVFRVVSQRFRLAEGFRDLLDLTSGVASIIALLPLPLTQTGILVHIELADNVALEPAFRYVASPECVAGLLGTELPRESQESLLRELLPSAPPNIRERISLSSKSSGRAIIWTCSSTRLASHRRLRSVLRTNAWIPLLVGPGPHVERRFRQILQQADSHLQHELADLTLDSETLHSQQVESLLCESQNLIGYSSACLLRISPIEGNYGPDAPMLVRTVASCPMQGIEANSDATLMELCIESEQFEQLFNRRVPWLDNSGKVALIPVVAGNRTIGLLRFEFATRTLCESSMALMIGQSGRLGSRLPYRRFFDLLRDTTELAEHFTDTTWTTLASKVAFQFSECMCSIWTSKESGEYECLGRAGSDLDLVLLPRDQTEKGLIATCLGAGGILVVRLDADDCPAECKDELRSNGFNHGIAVAAKPSEEENAPLLALMLWSKTKWCEDYFSKDDQEFLRVLSLFIQRMLALHRLAHIQKSTYQDLVKGLSHELGAPLSTLHDAISLAEIEGFGRHHLVDDLKTLIMYSKELIANLQLFSRVARRRHGAPSDSEPVQPVQLFKDIIYPISSTQAFFIRQKGLSLDSEFDPSEFPTSFAVKRVEAAMIRSVCFNLMDNAVKYTLPRTEKPIHVLGTVDGDFAVIRVSNWGIGIPEGEEDVIFEEEKQGSNAHQSAIAGHGMGLYISRVFIELLGGYVELARASNPTVFQVGIPMSLARYSFRNAPNE